MRIRLWQRLFLAFAAISVTALLTLYFVQQRTFQRSFLEYVNHLGTDRLTLIAARLGTRYTEVGDWRFLEENPRAFNRLLEGDERLPPGPLFKGRPSPDDAPPPEDRPPPNRRPPPDRDGQAEAGRKAPPAKQIDALNFNSRVALYAADGHRVIGNPEVLRDSAGVAVMSNGQIVGRLVLAPTPTLQSAADVAFVQSQTQSALLAAIGVLIGVLAVALVMSRWLLAPVKWLGSGTHKLVEGQYEVRINTKRGDELGDLARDFNRLAETLERNREARRQWGADIAHELRTPLSILSGEIQALQDGVRPLGATALASLQAECNRLTALVEDLYLLALSDTGALEYRFSRLDLMALLKAVVDEHAPQFSASGLTLTLEGPSGDVLPVRADSRRLFQLFGNLLANARRYTNVPGKVRISIEKADSSARQVYCVHVDDSPPGVASQHLPHLFDRLFRVESSRNRAAGGAGLGLSICKNIAEAHGGTMNAAPSPLGGLRISLMLPMLTGEI